MKTPLITPEGLDKLKAELLRNSNLVFGLTPQPLTHFDKLSASLKGELHWLLVEDFKFGNGARGVHEQRGAKGRHVRWPACGPNRRGGRPLRSVRGVFFFGLTPQPLADFDKLSASLKGNY